MCQQRIMLFRRNQAPLLSVTFCHVDHALDIWLPRRRRQVWTTPLQFSTVRVLHQLLRSHYRPPRRRIGWPRCAAASLESVCEPASVHPLYEGELFDEHAALVCARRHYAIAVAASSAAIVGAFCSLFSTLAGEGSCTDACLHAPAKPHTYRVRRFESDDVRLCVNQAKTTHAATNRALLLRSGHAG